MPLLSLFQCPPYPVPTPSPGHLIGNVMHSEVVQSCGVVAVQQGVQEGAAVPVGHRIRGYR